VLGEGLTPLKSVMPDGLQGGLSPSDFGDLIHFLESLRDKMPEAPKKTGRLELPFGLGRRPLFAEAKRSTLVSSETVLRHALLFDSVSRKF
jgi:hypothetical protein